MAFTTTYACGDAEPEFPVHVLETQRALFEDRFLHRELRCQNPIRTDVYSDVTTRIFKNLSISVSTLWRWEEPNSQCATRLRELEAQHRDAHGVAVVQKAIVFIVSGDDVSWQHFMQDALPLLAACRSHLKEHENMTLIFPRRMDHIVYMLDVLGVSNPILWLDDTTVSVQELHVPAFMPDTEPFWKRHVSSKWRRLVAQLLQQRLALSSSRVNDHHRDQGQIILYLSRNNCGQRRVHNETDVLNILQRYASTQAHETRVVVFDHADWPALEQRFCLFYNASVIVAPHGGAVYHIYAARPQTSMIEIVSGTGPLSCSVAHLATALQLQYYMQLAPDGSHSGVGYHLNVQHLLACLQLTDKSACGPSHKLSALQEQVTPTAAPTISMSDATTGMLLRTSAHMTDMDIGPLVSILCPTRKRPTQLRKSLLTLSTLANHPERIEFLLGVDLDDMDSIRTLPDLQTQFPNCREVYFPQRHGYHQLHLYINRLCALSTAPLLFLWNDDAEMETKGWDDILWKATVATNHPVYAFFAYHNGNATTEFPVITRSFYTVTGHFSLNAHNDTWVEEVLKPLQLYKHIPIYVRHLRYDPNPQARAALSYADTQQSEQISKREYYSAPCHEQRRRDTEAIRHFCTMQCMQLEHSEGGGMTQHIWSQWLLSAPDWLIEHVQQQRQCGPSSNGSCVVKLTAV